MKKVTFNTKIGIVMHKIETVCNQLGSPVKTKGRTMCIHNPENSVQDSILSIVGEVFHGKPTKHIKINFFDDRLFLRFKKAV